MAWITVTVNEVFEELAPLEAAALKAIAPGDRFVTILGRAVNAARGACRAGGYKLGPDGTVPDQLESDVVAIARWRCLIAYPQLAKLQTKERQEAYTAAMERLDKVSVQKIKIEPPDEARGEHERHAPAAGNWNSENKLIPRTHPVPPPGMQFEATPENQPPYANPRERDEPARPLKPTEGYPDD
jgi:hypothetical protein